MEIKLDSLLNYFHCIGNEFGWSEDGGPVELSIGEMQDVTGNQEIGFGFESTF